MRAMKKAVSSLTPWITLVGVLGAMAAQLRFQGRFWRCTCGYILAWSGNVNSSDNSQQLFDPYSFTHVLHGFMFIGAVHLLWPRLSEVWKIVAALSLEAVWEVIENTSFIINRYRSETISHGYVGDTILNSFGDIMACALGAVVAWRLGVKKTLIVTVLIEAALLVTVRDSLLVNIIMLLYPIDAIRQWQAG
jgi:hypothetical protein